MGTDSRHPVWIGLRPAAPALGLGLLVLGLLFHAEAAAAVHVWNTSTAYGHCWLVLPIVAWLAYERRYEAAATALAPIAWPALLALPLTCVWLAADLVGIMEARQLASIGMVELLLLAALGLRLWWALAAALLYLFFLVPFGAFVTPLLQHFTAAFIGRGLDFLGIPADISAFRIDIPEGSFYVAEACAGLRFLIASIAFGVLYAVTMFQSPWRRAVFIAAACIVPVIANGFRALGIVTLGHVLGSAQAAATDHILYGWIFFSIVILILALAGMPFRQDPQAAPKPAAPPPPGTARRAMLAVWPVLLVAALGPATSLWLDGRPGQAANAGPVLRLPEGCALTRSEPAGPVLTQHFQCGPVTIVARLEILPSQSNPARVTGAPQLAVADLLPGTDLDGGALTVTGTTPRAWLLQSDNEKRAAAAYVLFIDGKAALGGLHDRLQLARDLLTNTGTTPAALVVAVTPTKSDPQQALQLFLSGQGDLPTRVAALAVR
jgi:exosortase A